MKLTEVIQEVGPLSVLASLSALSADLSVLECELEQTLPVLLAQDQNTDSSIRRAIREALSAPTDLTRKHQLVLLGPELIVLEEMANVGYAGKVIIAVDSTLPAAGVQRIAHNTPPGLDCEVAQAPAFPVRIEPKTTSLLAVGLDAGCNYVRVIKETLELLAFFHLRFHGEVILLDPLGFGAGLRAPMGWTTVIRHQFFTQSRAPFQRMETVA